MHNVQKWLIILVCFLMPIGGLAIWLNEPMPVEANQTTANSSNLIQNGDFSSGTDNWWINGSDITTDTSTGALCITINTDGANRWDVQVGQSGFALQDGVQYRIAFEAKASSDRDISYKTGNSSYQDFTYQTKPVSTSYSVIETIYTQATSEPDSWFELHLATEGTGEICLDNVTVEPVSSNLIVNGDFSDGFNNWFTSIGGTGTVTTDTLSGALCVTLTNDAANAYEIIIGQDSLNLGKGNTYQIKFDAKADSNRNISYKTGESNPPYVDYTYQTTGISTTWQTITHEYVQPADDATAQLQFHLGGQGTGVICVDNVELTLTAEAPPSSGDNLLVNGDFESGLLPWQMGLSGTGAATTDTSAGELCTNITDASATQWEIVVNQGGINLEEATDYEISFDVKADASRDLFFKTGSTSYDNYTYQSAQATTSWATVSVTYTQSISDSNSVFEFQLGGNGTGEICIDNVVLKKMSPPLDRDIARNGDFSDGSASWMPYTQNGAALDMSIVSGEMLLAVSQIGVNDYDAMLWQLNLPVVNTYQYSLQFDAWTDIPDGQTREILAKVGKNAAPYDTYGGGTLDLTNVTKNFTFDFTMNNETDVCGKIEFHLGQATGDVYIDNVKLLTNAPKDFETGSEDYDTESLHGASMRQLAIPRNMVIGAASDTSTFLCNNLHNDVLTTEFGAFTPANAMKMGSLVPVRGEYYWDDADAMVDFVEAEGMEFHGHALIWHNQMPGWAASGSFTRPEMIKVMNDHIDTTVGRYKGRIAVWDVVNEAIDDDTYGLRVTPWQENIGDDYIDLAFTRARQADPTTQLLYNDYNISQLGHPKADATFAMIQRMVITDNVPIDGVGFQMHWDITGPPDIQAVIDNMARYDEIGIDVYITEIDVRIPDTMTEESLDAAAELYADMLQVCLDAPNCDHYTTWGISDSDSWIPGFFSGYGRAHIFDEDFKAKPAFHALTDVLAAYYQYYFPIMFSSSAQN